MNKIIEKSWDIIKKIERENEILYINKEGDLQTTAESNYEWLSEGEQKEINNGLIFITEINEKLAKKIIDKYKNYYS